MRGRTRSRRFAVQEPVLQGLGMHLPFASLRRSIEAGYGDAYEALKLMAKNGNLHLACMVNGHQYGGSWGADGTFSTDTPVEIGCIAKNLTSLLVAMAVSEGLIAYEDRVSSFFSGLDEVHPSLKVYHLLNQSHGLDGSALAAIPYTADDHIDAAILWEQACTVPVISPPGALFYNYGAVGFWLAASILERVYCTRFAVLVNEKILKRIEATAGICARRGPCPASGGISLSCNELLKVSRLHLEAENHELRSSILQLQTRYPMRLSRWPSRGDSACLGWFCFDTAFGMFGQGPGTAALIMISPREQTAVALASRGLDAAAFAQGVLSGVLGRLKAARPPRLLNRDERRSSDTTGIPGRYRKASLVLDVDRSAGGDLQASVYLSQHGGEVESFSRVSRQLLPATDDVFYSSPPDPVVLPYIKFRDRDADGYAQYAITGKHIFRRVCS